MIVGINLLFIQPGRNRGVETYVRGILPFFRERSALRPLLYLNRNNAASFRGLGFDQRDCTLSGRCRFTRLLYEQLFLEQRARADGVDLMFWPGYLGPVFPRLPTVITIHDTQFRDIPELLPWSFRMTYEAIVPVAARRADHLITVSEFSRMQICRHFNVRKFQVTSIPEGTMATASVPTDEDDKQLRELGVRPPYLLSISSGAPHKNTGRLLVGFRKALPELPADIKLVLAGQKGPSDRHVKYLGYVSDSLRDALYRRALVFVFPSLYEGFGLPVLEAMAHRIPVACSEVASLPEVGGDAVSYFDPLDVDAMTQVIKDLVKNESLRKKRIAAGVCQAARFTWKCCAEKTLDVLEMVARR